MSGKVLSLREIKAILPQRYPMLMLDRVELESDAKATAIKNVSMNEAFFQGHFPNHPIMPGVLQVEAMKQLCEILARPKLDPKGEADVYMRLVEKVKFRKPNHPGDRIKISAELIETGDHELVFRTEVANNSGVTCESKMTLAVRAKTGPAAMPGNFGEFDKHESSAMDVTKIMELIPHRYPFLFIDHISVVEGDRIVAVKNVTGNEEIYAHTPDDYATLPEAIQCEILAQAGCIGVLAREENRGKIGYFMSIDRAECFAPVYPGDQLICDITIPAGKGRFGKGNGTIKVDGKVVFEIIMMFAIVDA
ncbi:MAG: 3-hydroxyacyl-ACP dehydratase FabZ [Victivallaceae bacterium]